jgi:hypothetical protein
MIRDRDRINGAIVTRRLRALGIRDNPIAPATPLQTGFAELLIGSVWRECLDHIIVSGEAHLRRILISDAAYYNSLGDGQGGHATYSLIGIGHATSTTASSWISGAACVVFGICFLTVEV